MDFKVKQIHHRVSPGLAKVQFTGAFLGRAQKADSNLVDASLAGEDFFR